MNSHDIELLRRYVFERSEAAFADLVRQHIALVYSAALRQTNGDAPLAEDATQVVFTDLARKAARLTRHTSLAGWLYTSTRYAAATLRRAEQRRSAREQEAHAMNQLLQPAGTDPAWEQLRPVLDEAMHDLKADDREAVLLRYFEHLPLATVGARLGVTENTARMRVDRALDKLRGALAKRGVTSTAGALAVVLTAQAASAAPAGLAAGISATAVASAGTVSAFAVLLARCLISTKLKLLAGTAVLAAIVIPVVWHRAGPNQNVVAVSAPVQPAADIPAAQADAASANDNPTAQAEAMAITNTSFLRLTILAADVKKPIAAVEVECTATKDKQHTREKFISRRDGICDVHYPKDTDTLELVSRTDGFADTILHWDPAKGDTVPTKYTLRLARAVHMGGDARLEDGTPVPGLKVEFARNIAQEDPALVLAHENHEFKWMEAVTDARGRWRMDRMAPEVLGRALGMVNQPDYLLKIEPFGSIQVQEQLSKDAFVFILTPAPKIRGTVTDAQGNPVPGAKVIVGEYKPSGGGPFGEASTLADGSFVVKRGQPEDTLISFRAKGFVPRVVKLQANTDPSPLQVVLDIGRTMRLRVVDPEGRPVVKAKVLAELSQTPAVLASTDAQGRATVQQGQTDPLELRVEANGFQSAPVSAAGAAREESTIALSRSASVTVSGTVTDATTGQPVASFRAICGNFLFSEPSPTTFHPSSSSEDWFKFGGGKFRLDPGRFLDHFSEAKRRGFALKFEAEGYAPMVSRLIQADEGEVRLEVALVPAQATQVTVLNRNGRPATDAEIGLVGPGLDLEITRDRHLRVMRGSGVAQAGSEGKFSLPPDDSIAQVIAISPRGFADASPAALAREPVLQLQPFGRVEGQWVLGNLPVAGREVTLTVMSPGSPGYSVDCSTTTDTEGRFAIPQVPAGHYQLMCNVPRPDGGYTSEELANIEVQPGETSVVTAGGYVISVRLRWPADLGPGKATRVRLYMHTPSPEPPADIIHDPQTLSRWVMSPEIQAQLRTVQGCTFVEGADGSWTAEGAQAGATYLLEADVMAKAATNRTPSIAYGRLSVTIPAQPASGTLDAGELVLQPVNSAAAPVGER